MAGFCGNCAGRQQPAGTLDKPPAVAGFRPAVRSRTPNPGKKATGRAGIGGIAMARNVWVAMSRDGSGQATALFLALLSGLEREPISNGLVRAPADVGTIEN
jgi:hypothetical protein